MCQTIGCLNGGAGRLSNCFCSMSFLWDVVKFHTQERGSSVLVAVRTSAVGGKNIRAGDVVMLRKTASLKRRSGGKCSGGQDGAKIHIQTAALRLSGTEFRH